jgi:hypothetical protein
MIHLLNFQIPITLYGWLCLIDMWYVVEEMRQSLKSISCMLELWFHPVQYKVDDLQNITTTKIT